MQKIIKLLFDRIRDVTKEDLFPAFEKFLKERGRALDDVTELLQSKEFSCFKNASFYMPTAPKKEGEEKQSIALTDLFTVATSHAAVEPWLLSDGMCAVLGLPRAQQNEIQSRTEKSKEWLKNFKKQPQWKSDWNAQMKPVYGKEFTTLPKDIDSLLQTPFESNTFSVVSYGKVSNITQRVYAIFQSQKRDEGKRSISSFVLKQIYQI